MKTKNRPVKGSTMLGIGGNPAYSDAIELFEQACDGYRRFHILKAAIDLELFSWLAEFGPAAPHRIAESMMLNEHYILPVIQALMEDGFLEQQGHKVALSEAAARLFGQDSPVKPAQMLARTAGPSSQWGRLSVLMQNRFEAQESGNDVEHADAVHPGDYILAERAVRQWAGFEQAKSVLDLGGSGGELVIALCKENHKLRATILASAPEIEMLTRRVANAGLTDRVGVIGDDLFSVESRDSHDIVLAVHSLYAFPKRILAAMEKIATMLHVDGLLVTQHCFAEGPEPQWENCVRELDQRMHRVRRPLRHPEAFADRVTSAGFCWLKGQNLHGDKNGVQLRLAQRCSDGAHNTADGCDSIESAGCGRIAAAALAAL